MLINQTLKIGDCDIKYATKEGAFSGYGSVFNVLDTNKDIVMPGAYEAVLKSGDPIKVYVNHGWLRGELPIGEWSDLKEDKHGLFGAAGLVMQMPTALNAYWAMKSGLVSGLSVAIIPDHTSVERRTDGARIIHSIKHLKEISIVTDPANELSLVTDLKFAEAIDQVETVRDFERLLRDVGTFDQATAKLVVAKAKAVFQQRDVGEGAKLTAAILDRIQNIAK